MEMLEYKRITLGIRKADAVTMAIEQLRVGGRTSLQARQAEGGIASYGEVVTVSYGTRFARTCARHGVIDFGQTYVARVSHANEGWHEATLRREDEGGNSLQAKGAPVRSLPKSRRRKHGPRTTEGVGGCVRRSSVVGRLGDKLERTSVTEDQIWRSYEDR